MIQRKYCSYGCGKEAKYEFKNGMSCCSKSTNQCPIIIEKNKIKHPKSGNPWKNRKHPMQGRKNPHKGIYKYNWKKVQEYYNEGYTIRECYKKFGISRGAVTKACLRGDLKTRNLSDAMKISVSKGRVSIATSKGWNKKLRKRLSIVAKRKKLGGKRNSYCFNYNGIILDSSYELRIAKLFDKQKIYWIRPKYLIWLDSNRKSHRYYPDFYLPIYDLYLDSKNDYLIKIDKEKIKKVIEYNYINIMIVSLNQIKYWEQNGIDTIQFGNII